MKCPIDDTPLAITERSGVEIDYCPQCRGIWLDRGELDKILDRAGGPDDYGQSGTDTGRYDKHGGYGKHGGGNHGRTGSRRRGGFLGEIFDF